MTGDTRHVTHKTCLFLSFIFFSFLPKFIGLSFVQLSAHIERFSVRISLKNLFIGRSFWFRQITILKKKIVPIHLLSKPNTPSKLHILEKTNSSHLNVVISKQGHVFEWLSFCKKQNCQPNNFFSLRGSYFLNNNLIG